MTAAALSYAQYSVLVVGAGSSGRRHMANLRKRGVQRLAAVDADAERLRPATEELGVAGFPDLAPALAAFRPQIVFICPPPAFHVEHALQSLRADADVFIEKPLSHCLDGVGELSSEASNRGRVVQVGYNLRFHPGIRTLKRLVNDGVAGRILWARAEIGQYLPDWRPRQGYRQSYTARRRPGGGLIFD